LVTFGNVPVFETTGVALADVLELGVAEPLLGALLAGLAVVTRPFLSVIILVPSVSVTILVFISSLSL
jgi:hypothetical protein